MPPPIGRSVAQTLPREMALNPQQQKYKIYIKYIFNALRAYILHAAARGWSINRARQRQLAVGKCIWIVRVASESLQFPNAPCLLGTRRRATATLPHINGTEIAGATRSVLWIVSIASEGCWVNITLSSKSPPKKGGAIRDRGVTG